MNKSIKLSALVVAMMLSSGAFAAKAGYATDGALDNVARNAYGECWKDGYFNKATDGLVECGDKEAPKPVAVAPVAPAPAVVSQIKSFTLSAAGLFAFDKTVITSGNAALDGVVAELKGDKYLKSVAIVGHTDYMGAEAYNQKLSERRANAVKDYLVAGGIPAEKITASGAGESQAKLTEQCSKIKARTQRIACLEPDRRFEVTVETAKEVKM
ncbi:MULTISPECIES: OmpA family protein [Vogesella]|jgi:OOP family OmpA-OmpF porin|uniref:OmpA family protein n=1 Tax=Vogesella indigofera TaxID=45465 RepID=A0ABT5I1F4_VOGIN|nr:MULTISPECIES: OmpA family protein [Vogesella]KMJ52952.1 membrane protein [Vogesella sp. EB]MDC7690001.1 OmpA family protein [Vogesella indigofera]